MKNTLLLIITVITLNTSIAQTFKKTGALIGIEPVSKTGIKTGLFYTINNTWTFQRLSLNYGYLTNNTENVISSDYAFSLLLFTAGVNLNYSFKYSNWGLMPKIGLTLPDGWIQWIPGTIVATYGYNQIINSNYENDLKGNVFTLEYLVSFNSIFSKKD